MPDGGPAPARPDAPRLRRMPAIDGLRAVAVAAVFLYHADAAWLPGGFFGVDVFFVISGYLITSLLLAESVQTGTVALLRFWAGRARRLLPALFTLLAVCLLVGATWSAASCSNCAATRSSSIFYVANWRFIFEHESYFAQFGRPPLLRHLWSLAVEEQFYLVWPPLFLLALRLRARAVLPVLVALRRDRLDGADVGAVHPGSDTSRVFYGTDTRAAPMLVGVLLAFLWKPSALPDVRNRVRARLAARDGRACSRSPASSTRSSRCTTSARRPIAAASSCSRSAPRCCSRRSCIRAARWAGCSRCATPPLDRRTKLRHLPVALARARLHAPGRRRAPRRVARWR